MKPSISEWIGWPVIFNHLGGEPVTRTQRSTESSNVLRLVSKNPVSFLTPKNYKKKNNNNIRRALVERSFRSKSSSINISTRECENKCFSIRGQHVKDQIRVCTLKVLSICVGRCCRTKLFVPCFDSEYCLSIYGEHRSCIFFLFTAIYCGWTIVSR